MYLTWGGASFAVNSCNVAARVRISAFSDYGLPLRYLAQFSVDGDFAADGQAACSAAEATLRAILLVPYQTLSLRTDSGAATATTLSDPRSFSGVVVKDGPNFTGRDGSEYATGRTFEFTAEAEYMIASAANAVVSWQEQVTITGTGGPVFRRRQPLTGRAIPQRGSEFSIVRATQSGTAVGHTRRPTPPRPLWGRGYELEDQRQVSPASPRRTANNFHDFGISWSYQFESELPLVGLPSLPPL
jgi:uncharacterized protein (UPF0333 family)